MKIDRKKHWQNVYEKKQPHEVSWTQDHPKTSLDFIRDAKLSKSAKIIDVGGGDSKLVDFLLDEGYQDITILDISSNALERAKIRLGKKAALVTWIVSDIIDFEPEIIYDLWHDRATFHFQTDPEQINKYIEIAKGAVKTYLILSTFSEDGPEKCSGLDVQQYSVAALEALLYGVFTKTTSFIEDHQTPFATLQNFLYCGFKRNTN